jgi:hypothetical protein
MRCSIPAQRCGHSFARMLQTTIRWFLLLPLVTCLDQIQCGTDETLVQIPSKQILSNGCSKPSFIKVEGEEDFTYCCDRHDACYACCGISKGYCDDDFEKCMLKLCSSNFKSSSQCKTAASTYALGTKVFGQTGFIESQNDYCFCEKSDKVDEHYENVIQKFYSTHVPSKPSIDLPRILSSYASTPSSSTASSKKKYHQLYYDLHKKYDHAIGHIEGRKHKLEIPRPPAKVKEL